MPQRRRCKHKRSQDIFPGGIISLTLVKEISSSSWYIASGGDDCKIKVCLHASFTQICLLKWSTWLYWDYFKTKIRLCWNLTCFHQVWHWNVCPKDFSSSNILGVLPDLDLSSLASKKLEHSLTRYCGAILSMVVHKDMVFSGSADCNIRDF